MTFLSDISALLDGSGDPLLQFPAAWPRVPLGSVCTIVNGFPFASESFGAEGVPLLRIRDVARGDTTTRYSGDVPNGFWVKPTDLVVGMDGDFNLNAWKGEPALLNQRVCRLDVDDRRLNRRFLYYALPAFLRLINKHTPSVTVKHLSSRTLQTLPFPLPPIDLQRAVVRCIEVFFTDIDDGEAALGRARADLEVYRRALLKTAVTGELTADWRASNPPRETGAELLARILADRRARWHADAKNSGRNYKSPVVPDISLLPELPSSWTWASIDQLTFDVRNGISTKPTHGPDGEPILRISSVRPMSVDGSLRRWLKPGTTPPDCYASAGDLLFTRYNGSPEFVGVCGQYRGAEEITYPDKLVRARTLTSSKNMPDLIEAFSNVGASRKHIERFIKTTAGQHGVSGETIKSTPVPLPPEQEFIELRSRIRTVLGLEVIQVDLKDLQYVSNTLRQSILSAAFRGELLPP